VAHGNEKNTLLNIAGGLEEGGQNRILWCTKSYEQVYKTREWEISF